MNLHKVPPAIVIPKPLPLASYPSFTVRHTAITQLRLEMDIDVSREMAFCGVPSGA